MSGDFSSSSGDASLAGETLRRWQLERLNQQLARVLPLNRFYSRKLAHIRYPVESLEDLRTWPCTTKDELAGGADCSPPLDLPLAASSADWSADAGLARNLTYPLEQYVRFHRTSGTRGRPLVVLDTADDWQWWIDGWQLVLDAARIAPSDRVVLAFSFGPFIGFWSAFEALTQRGALVIPTGGMSTSARLDLIASMNATAVFCTPTYALRLAEVAQERQMDLRQLGVRTIVVAGEPGGSVPATRRRIERAWRARVVDHAGASEVGPWGFAAADDSGLHVNEREFIVELLRPGTVDPAGDDEQAELVLTTLGRAGCPVFRYRTGDLVVRRVRRDLPCPWTFLDGGVLGRADDMLIVRGVNVFPSSIEAMLHELPQVVEYRLTARREGSMDALLLEVESTDDQVASIADHLQVRLGLAIDVRRVAAGTLPRFEAKARRFIDQRPAVYRVDPQPPPPGVLSSN
ncbi:MAG: AMP-binding protein [Pirellulales bacterium]